MLILIDGYNFLKYANKSSYISDMQRKRFIAACYNYAKRQQNEIKIVFDGGDYWQPYKAHVESPFGKYVNVIYSGQKNDADYYIQEFFAKYSNQPNLIQDMILVSSDRELCDIVNSYGVYCLSVADFLYLIQNKDTDKTRLNTKNQNSSQAYKITDKTNPELDALMQESNIPKDISKKDVQEVEPLFSLKNKKKGKLDKIQEKIIKKLISK